MSYDHLVLALAAGDRVAVDWIVACAKVVVAQRGRVGLEAAARLSRSPDSRRRGLRDAYIRQAALALGEDGYPASQINLHRAFEEFRRTRWPEWCKERYAPAEANAAEVAMFNALKCGELPGSPQMLGRIVRAVGGN